MGRPPLPLGTYGKIRLYNTTKGWKARSLYRDYDGTTRHVERHGKTKGAAERALAEALRDRARFDAGDSLSPDTRVSVVAEQWFTELGEQGRSPSTMQAYRDRLDRQIIPALGRVRVRELTVGLVDRHLAAVRAKHGAAMAKQTKSVLSGICGLACRHDALEHNPCRDVARISTKPKNPPRSMSVEQIQDLRAWLTYDDTAVEKDLPDLVAFMAATGMRIGEACAVMWEDLDLENGTVRVRGTVLRLRGQGLIIKPTPKTKAGERILELPSWCVELLVHRSYSLQPDRTDIQDRSYSQVFPTELGNLRDPSNTRRDLREAFKRAGHAGLTSHAFRKTVATLMDEAGLSARAAADQLGHAQVSMTTDTYYGRKKASTGAAGVLEILG